jgi:hypothetical protein
MNAPGQVRPTQGAQVPVRGKLTWMTHITHPWDACEASLAPLWSSQVQPDGTFTPCVGQIGLPLLGALELLPLHPLVKTLFPRGKFSQLCQPFSPLLLTPSWSLVPTHEGLGHPAHSWASHPQVYHLLGWVCG